MAALSTIAAIVGAAATAASTGYALSKGSPKLPEVKPPTPPPPVPPPPPPSPAFAPETAEEEPAAAAKKKRQLAYGIEKTMVASPLGSGIGRSTLGG